MQCLVKCTEEYKPAIPEEYKQICNAILVKFTKEYKGIQTCNTWSNYKGIKACNRNTSMQYLVKFTNLCLIKYKPAIPGTKLVKFTQEYKHAIPDLIYKGIEMQCLLQAKHAMQACNSMPYLVKCIEEYKPAIPGQIYKGIQACDTCSNLLRNTNLQYLVKFI